MVPREFRGEFMKGRVAFWEGAGAIFHGSVQPGKEVGIEFLEYGLQNIVLAFEVPVERASGNTGGFRDFFDRCPAVSPGQKQRDAFPEDRFLDIVIFAVVHYLHITRLNGRSSDV